MLYEFLEQHRAEILALAEVKTVKLAGSLPTSDELKKGLNVFYEHLISYLTDSLENSPAEKIVKGASDHGRELMRLNYTLSHVVHSYGAICQAVTELAQRREARISAQEFNDLNLCLDIAISAAVTEFQFNSVLASEEREVQHLGFLVHELRNALSSATVAHEMITQGLVGTGGSTAKILKDSLVRMRILIDRSLSEVRMRADPTIHVEKFHLAALVEQILLSALSEARMKNLTFRTEISSTIELETDRQLLLSAIANLVQNALKYSKAGGVIFLRSGVSGSRILLEVEDEGGGIDPKVLETLFQPFTSGTLDKSGLGLGLTIVQRAVALLQGKVSVRNNPGKGCVFLVDIPIKVGHMSLPKNLPGTESAQPEIKNKN